jgi:hypothetical protein
MAFRVIAGDLHSLSKYNMSKLLDEKKLIAALIDDKGKTRVEEIDIRGNIDKIELVTEESKKNFIGTAGWGLVGAAALGPIGLIAGALAGGNKKEICFACHLKNGYKFMAISSPDIYQDFVGAQYEKPKQEKPKKKWSLFK